MPSSASSAARGALAWLTLTVRWTPGPILAFGALAFVSGWYLHARVSAQVVPRMTADPSPWVGKTLAMVLVRAGAALLAGGGTVLATFATLAAFSVMHRILSSGDAPAHALNTSCQAALVCYLHLRGHDRFSLGVVFGLDRPEAPKALA